MVRIDSPERAMFRQIETNKPFPLIQQIAEERSKITHASFDSRTAGYFDGCLGGLAADFAPRGRMSGATGRRFSLISA
ncbi:hypothetical protein KOR42_44020 [Thalassoglobus neptunius]|uniref:Uncharacterized protein n=1 Tax=Thalassoglobus neptunius TaxID=1938619 RepID=A0A5C5VYV1_9PLAN|nr:hypothetical protein KOR42_44020 [Thalassoglobus neptunius]